MRSLAVRSRALGLELGEHLFDRVQIRRVGRQVRIPPPGAAWARISRHLKVAI
jgi:hypothetical protein